MPKCRKCPAMQASMGNLNVNIEIDNGAELSVKYKTIYKELKSNECWTLELQTASVLLFTAS